MLVVDCAFEGGECLVPFLFLFDGFGMCVLVSLPLIDDSLMLANLVLIGFVGDERFNQFLDFRFPLARYVELVLEIRVGECILFFNDSVDGSDDDFSFPFLAGFSFFLVP